MSEQKSFPASEQKLRKLRLQGVVPYSRDLSSFSMLLGLALALLFVARKVGDDFIARFGESFQVGSIAELIRLYSRDIFTYFAISLAAFFVFLLPVALYQTRALFSIGNAVSFDLGRIFRLNVGIRGSEIVQRLVKFILWSSIFTMLMVYILREEVPRQSAFGGFKGLISIAEADAVRNVLVAEVSNWLSPLLRVSIWVLVFSFAIGIASRFIVVLSFLNEHRMSRQEAEQEYRESEVSPELKRNLLDRQSPE